jgi:hypothetical protein
VPAALDLADIAAEVKGFALDAARRRRSSCA